MPRERLFSLIDQRLNQPGVWIVGQPGAGKTTLVASYLADRSLRGIWYQLDAADSDPATFFYFLGLAASRSRPPRRAMPLPLLTPEYLADIDGFARRFFRALLAEMGEGAVIVLDNFQEVSPDSALQKFLPLVLEEIPAEGCMIFVSREEPSRHFSRSQLVGQISLIDWSMLRLTEAETRDIAESRALMDRATVERLHRQSGGWVAGLTLLLEQAKVRSDVPEVPDTASTQTLFDYFASQVFERLPTESQECLLKISFLPHTTSSMAEDVSQDANAPRLLEQLYRRHLFTDRRIGVETTYHLHALFSAFLQHESRRRLDPFVLAGLARSSARALASAGYAEDAATIYSNTADWRGLVDLLLANAGSFLGTGRWQRVLDWIGRLPADVAADHCWIKHWSGIARMATDPVRARTELGLAVTLAKETRDTLCFVLSVAGIIDSHCAEFNEFAPVDAWIPVLADALAAPPKFPDIDSELRVWSALLSALHYRHPEHPALDDCIRNVLVLLERGASANVRLHAATHLMNHGGNNGRLEITKRASGFVIPALHDPSLTPLTRAGCLYAASWYLYLSNRRTECADTVGELIQIGVEEGLSYVSLWGHTEAFLLEAILNMDVPSARYHLDQMRALADPGRAYDHALCEGMSGWLGVAREDPEFILAHADKGETLIQVAGIAAHLVIWPLPRLWALVEMNRDSEAVALIEQLRKLAHQHKIDAYETLLLAAEAMMALQSANVTDVRRQLKTLFVWSSQRNYGYLLSWYWPWMSSLCARALSEGIESEYVNSLITSYRWPPPEIVPDAWPWTVKIFCLGRFELLVNGRPVSFGRKFPKKLIAVLKLLVAMGGASVPEHVIIDALWGDEDADKALGALRVAVSRLRRLLSVEDAIHIHDNTVALDRQRVWVDAYELNELIGRETLQAPGQLDKVRKLYRGNFLPGDLSESWALSMRERLRSRFVKYVGECGSSMEGEGDLPTAINCYRDGLDADDLTEAFYQGLMRCHHRRGEVAEGLKVYQRLRRTFSLKLGIPPSKASEELHAMLRSAP